MIPVRLYKVIFLKESDRYDLCDRYDRTGFLVE